MRYALTLSYDGSAFKGWQVQTHASTIQESLQNALSTLLNGEIAVTGAGRTDTLVNAVGYVAHFDYDEAGLDAREFAYKLNAILPREVVVHRIEAVPDEFHARFGAVKRSYSYFLHRQKDPFIEKFSYRCGYPLDFDAMNKAASGLLGTHDFSCFEKVGGNNKTSICTVTEAHWETYTPTHVGLLGYPAEAQDYWVFHISADRFLRNMVRAIVGTLIDVGRGRHEPGWVEELLASKDRCCAGESVPGKALFLNDVSY